jgi:hypothetical protein
MEVLDEHVAEAPARAERFNECVANDDQRDHRDKQVRGDHKGKVLALDLIEPPDGFQRKRHPAPPLKLLLIPPPAGDPLRKSSGAAVAPFAHSAPLLRGSDQVAAHATLSSSMLQLINAMQITPPGGCQRLRDELAWHQCQEPAVVRRGQRCHAPGLGGVAMAVDAVKAYAACRAGPRR